MKYPIRLVLSTGFLLIALMFIGKSNPTLKTAAPIVPAQSATETSLNEPASPNIRPFAGGSLQNEQTVSAIEAGVRSERIDIEQLLAEARDIADAGDSVAFEHLARLITSREFTGDPEDMEVAAGMAEILGKMDTAEISSIATELAYSPSVLVSEAAVDAAIASKGPQTGQIVEEAANVGATPLPAENGPD